eukprot:ctg_1213.g377
MHHRAVAGQRVGRRAGGRGQNHPVGLNARHRKVVAEALEVAEERRRPAIDHHLVQHRPAYAARRCCRRRAALGGYSRESHRAGTASESPTSPGERGSPAEPHAGTGSRINGGSVRRRPGSPPNRSGARACRVRTRWRVRAAVRAPQTPAARRARPPATYTPRWPPDGRSQSRASTPPARTPAAVAIAKTRRAPMPDRCGRHRRRCCQTQSAASPPRCCSAAAAIPDRRATRWRCGRCYASAPAPTMSAQHCVRRAARCEQHCPPCCAMGATGAEARHRPPFSVVPADHSPTAAPCAAYVP